MAQVLGLGLSGEMAGLFGKALSSLCRTARCSSSACRTRRPPDSSGGGAWASPVASLCQHAHACGQSSGTGARRGGRWKRPFTCPILSACGTSRLVPAWPRPHRLDSGRSVCAACDSKEKRAALTLWIGAGAPPRILLRPSSGLRAVTHVLGSADRALLCDAGLSLACSSSKGADDRAASPALSWDLFFPRAALKPSCARHRR
jgi:hypothetical protein